MRRVTFLSSAIFLKEEGHNNSGIFRVEAVCRLVRYYELRTVNKAPIMETLRRSPPDREEGYESSMPESPKAEEKRKKEITPLK